MKRYIWFVIKAIIVAVIFSQTTMADTGYPFIGEAIDEPIYLTLCGLGLLYLGLYKKDKQNPEF